MNMNYQAPVQNTIQRNQPYNNQPNTHGYQQQHNQQFQQPNQYNNSNSNYYNQYPPQNNYNSQSSNNFNNSRQSQSQHNHQSYYGGSSNSQYNGYSNHQPPNNYYGGGGNGGNSYPQQSYHNQQQQHYGHGPPPHNQNGYRYPDNANQNYGNQQYPPSQYQPTPQDQRHQQHHQPPNQQRKDSKTGQVQHTHSNNSGSNSQSNHSPHIQQQQQQQTPNQQLTKKQQKAAAANANNNLTNQTPVLQQQNTKAQQQKLKQQTQEFQKQIQKQNLLIKEQEMQINRLRKQKEDYDKQSSAKGDHQVPKIIEPLELQKSINAALELEALEEEKSIIPFDDGNKSSSSNQETPQENHEKEKYIATVEEQKQEPVSSKVSAKSSQHSIEKKSKASNSQKNTYESHSNQKNNVSNNSINTQYRKIFVGGLPHNLSDEEFRSYFTQYGDIEDCAILKDKRTGKPRGFGFVTYQAIEQVDHVMNIKDQHRIQDKWVDCKRAVPASALKQEEQSADLSSGMNGMSMSISNNNSNGSFENSMNQSHHMIRRQVSSNPQTAPLPIINQEKQLLDLQNLISASLLSNPQLLTEQGLSLINNHLQSLQLQSLGQQQQIPQPYNQMQNMMPQMPPQQNMPPMNQMTNQMPNQSQNPMSMQYQHPQQQHQNQMGYQPNFSNLLQNQLSGNDQFSSQVHQPPGYNQPHPYGHMHSQTPQQVSTFPSQNQQFVPPFQERPDLNPSSYSNGSSSHSGYNLQNNQNNSQGSNEQDQMYANQKNQNFISLSSAPIQGNEMRSPVLNTQNQLNNQQQLQDQQQQLNQSPPSNFKFQAPQTISLSSPNQTITQQQLPKQLHSGQGGMPSTYQNSMSGFPSFKYLNGQQANPSQITTAPLSSGPLSSSEFKSGFPYSKTFQLQQQQYLQDLNNSLSLSAIAPNNNTTNNLNQSLNLSLNDSINLKHQEQTEWFIQSLQNQFESSFTDDRINNQLSDSMNKIKKDTIYAINEQIQRNLQKENQEEEKQRSDRMNQIDWKQNQEQMVSQTTNNNNTNIGGFFTTHTSSEKVLQQAREKEAANLLQQQKNGKQLESEKQKPLSNNSNNKSGGNKSSDNPSQKSGSSNQSQVATQPQEESRNELKQDFKLNSSCIKRGESESRIGSQNDQPRQLGSQSSSNLLALENQQQQQQENLPRRYVLGSGDTFQYGKDRPSSRSSQDKNGPNIKSEFGQIKSEQKQGPSNRADRTYKPY